MPSSLSLSIIMSFVYYSPSSSLLTITTMEDYYSNDVFIASSSWEMMILVQKLLMKTGVNFHKRYGMWKVVLRVGCGSGENVYSMVKDLDIE